MSEEQRLVERVGRGDEEALGALFERHREFVFRVALGCCGNREDAVDVVQESFLALLREAGSLDLSGTRLSTWLYRVARNKAIDSLRRGSRPAIEVSPAPEPAPDAVLLSDQRRRLLGRAVTELPPRSREVFVLRVGLALSVERTAELTDSEPGAVRTALTTAKRQLRTILNRMEKGSDARRLAVRR